MQRPTPLLPDERIRVYLLNNTKDALVWHANDVLRLRDIYHIQGTLIESQPGQPQQNLLHSLPLVLLPEEVTLLLHYGIVRLVEEATAYRVPTADELNAYLQIRRGEEQARHEEAQAAKQKREARWRQQTETTQPLDLPHRIGPDQSIDTNQAVRVHLPTAVPAEAAWHEERLGDNAFDAWTEARSAGVWLYPATDMDWQCFYTYHDLWQRGWRLGSGLKFGGHYLLYADHPQRCHAAYVANVCAANEPRSFTQLVGLGRLGTTVRKARLLCTVDMTAPNARSTHSAALDVPVQYLRLTWAGW